MATLMIAANLPDEWRCLSPTRCRSRSVAVTHGVLAQVALPIAPGIMAVGRPVIRTCPHLSTPARTRSHQLQGVAALTRLYSHIFLDYLNSYGLRLSLPRPLIRRRRPVHRDPGCGRFLAPNTAGSVAAWRGSPAPWQLARVALAAATAYALVMLASNVWARTVVRDGLTRAGRPPDTRFMVTPVFANPFRREVLVDTGDRYEKGFLWFEPGPHFRPAGYGVDRGFAQPEAQAALATPRAQAYLTWSRFPFFVVDRTEAPPQLWLNDYRYSDASGRVGWAGLGVRIDD
jgi:hypothetical protein